MWITAYLAMRPIRGAACYTCCRVGGGAILAGGDVQAQEILSALLTELTDEGVPGKTETRNGVWVQSVYTG